MFSFYSNEKIRSDLISTFTVGSVILVSFSLGITIIHIFMPFIFLTFASLIHYPLFLLNSFLFICTKVILSYLHVIDIVTGSPIESH